MSPKRFFYIGISILIVLCLLFGLERTHVIASDGSGCENEGSITGQIGDCYSPKIYEQNLILIQEQNQTNRLLAAEICTHAYDSWGFSSDDIFTKNSTGVLGNSHSILYTIFHKCMAQVLGDIK